MVLKLQSAGWDTESYSIAEQRSITTGRNVPVLEHKAKGSYKSVAEDMQRVQQYAEILGLKFAYVPNGCHMLESRVYFDDCTAATNRYRRKQRSVTKLTAHTGKRVGIF